MNQNPQFSFHIYRYQILPFSQQIPLFLDCGVKSIDELKEKKNEFFSQAIQEIINLIYERAELIHKIILNEEDIIIFKIGVNRKFNRDKPDFTVEEIDNWPNLHIIINNKANIQKIAIQFNRKAFGSTNTVANLLEQNIDAVLKKYYLKIHIKPIFTKQFFWDIVDKHPTGITQTCFDMVSPNMSNISHSLNLDLQQLNATTNTQETKLELNSDQSSNLNFDRDDIFINSLVDYASEGGGNISLKIKGYKRKFHTSNSIDEYEIDELEIKNATSKELGEIFKGILV